MKSPEMSDVSPEKNHYLSKENLDRGCIFKGDKVKFSLLKETDGLITDGPYGGPDTNLRDDDILVAGCVSKGYDVEAGNYQQVYWVKEGEQVRMPIKGSTIAETVFFEHKKEKK